MSSISHFQNNECILAFDKVSHVMKYPPDRLEVAMLAGETFTVLGDDCKAFLQNYMGYLNAEALRITASASSDT